MLASSETHDPKFGYNILDGLFEEDLVSALDQLIAERFGIARNPRERWNEVDGGMHVLSAALYGLMKQDGFARTGGDLEAWLLRQSNSGALAPRSLHDAAARCLEGPPTASGRFPGTPDARSATGGGKNDSFVRAQPFHRHARALNFALSNNDNEVFAIPPPYPRRSMAPPPPMSGPRYNEFIQSQKVRVIDENGENLGVMYTREAFEQAQEVGLDLVEISPNADPPVAKFLDIGRYKYEAQKKASRAAQEAEDAGDQGDQDASEHRRPRL